MTDPLPTLEGERLRLRPVAIDDRVAAPRHPRGAIGRTVVDARRRRITSSTSGSNRTRTRSASSSRSTDEVVGSLQIFEESGDDYRFASIDLFLDTAHQDQGLGSEAIRTVARYLFDDRGHHRLTIDPSAANARAIRAYERVGFRPIGIMRSYERGPDGTWHDNLLMDILVGRAALDVTRSCRSRPAPGRRSSAASIGVENRRIRTRSLTIESPPHPRSPSRKLCRDGSISRTSEAAQGPPTQVSRRVDGSSLTMCSRPGSTDAPSPGTPDVASTRVPEPSATSMVTSSPTAWASTTCGADPRSTGVPDSTGPVGAAVDGIELGGSSS